MNLPAAAGYLIGILIGLGVLVGGGILLLSGLKEPGIGRFAPVGAGVGTGGNISVWAGLILILMGLSIVIGVAMVGIRTWEGADFERADD